MTRHCGTIHPVIRRYLQLPKAERRDLYSAAWRLLVVRILLLFGIQRSLDWLGGTAAANPPTPGHTIWQRRAKALRRVGARLPGVACLARAVALRWWMRAHGLDARILIGVRPGEDGVASHAWVELDGHPVDDHPDHVRGFQLIFSA